MKAQSLVFITHKLESTQMVKWSLNLQGLVYIALFPGFWCCNLIGQSIVNTLKQSEITIKGNMFSTRNLHWNALLATANYLLLLC